MLDLSKRLQVEGKTEIVQVDCQVTLTNVNTVREVGRGRVRGGVVQRDSLTLFDVDNGDQRKSRTVSSSRSFKVMNRYKSHFSEL